MTNDKLQIVIKLRTCGATFGHMGLVGGETQARYEHMPKHDL
jgi:hypothetical protein